MQEPIKRAGRTFGQAALGYIVVNAATSDFSSSNAIKGFVIATIAAGLAAVMNINYGGKNDERN